MLDPRASSIEYQSAISMLEMLASIYDRKVISSDKAKTWSKINTIRFYLEVLADKAYASTEEKKELTYIYECLIQTANLNQFPIPPASFNLQAQTIVVGIPGPQGPAGQSAFLYLAYAEDGNGTGFSLNPGPNKNFVALVTSTFPVLNVTTSLFNGLWKQYIGTDGIDGVDGTDGIDGIDGRTILSGGSDPTTEGEDGDFYINTTSWKIFGPKASGAWPSGHDLTGPQGPAGTNGSNGLDGRTILNGAGVPDNGNGSDGDFYIDTLNNELYGPKAGGVWGTSTSLVGPQGPAGNDGNPGADGSNGTSNFIWVAYADDLLGNGFTLSFNNQKDYIAFLVTTTNTTPSSSDFANLWVKYRGDGDRWATFSNNSMTIGTGTFSFQVEPALSYTTGQFIVIAHDNDPANRMEGHVISYNPVNGQITVDVSTAEGSGTFDSWDVNLQAGSGSGTPVSGVVGVPTENTDIDTGTEVVDTFPTGDMKGVVWHIVLEKGSDRKVLVVMATWTGSTVTYAPVASTQIGDASTISVSVDINTGNVRLLATVTTDNWIATAVRYPIVGP